ncbi:L-xylulose/3-keto-L-gulonate kinase [Escherichia albertii TW07627]|uniref:3-dehydro-L-gulonate-6-phosphate decarboxylase n=3 Tax=Escherichia albertii TaxID=208962 RepID=A0ABC9NSX4_ESCAT|nr:L-xylulose/3-keto-L-gulonate kinase [Escherichia albertii TW07627]GAL54848.1 putative carbohydrate kinase [Escherichia albertii NBRC 107761 = DSM 17582]
MTQYWLGLDCGGSWLKAGLYDREGREAGVQRLPLCALSPQPGWAERDMAELWQCCMAVIRNLLTYSGVSGEQIVGIGISAQGKGLFLLDKNDKLLGNAILSSDRRAMEIVRRWQKDGIPEKLYPLTRQTLWTGHPVSLLRWLKEHEPERYAQIGCVMMTHDYLRWCLTSVKGCEESNISESNLYNMNSGQYDSCLTDGLGISEINHALPPVVGSAEICGEITAQTAALTGLKAGTPVVGGLFDVVSTALCAGIEDEYTLNAVMGTWAVTSGITRGLRDDEAHPYVYGRYVNDSEFIVHEASPTSSGNLEWFTAQWGEISFAEINQAIASLPKAGGDLFFLPFLYGSNAGLEMTSGFYGMQAIHTRAHLLQAIYEGVVFSHMTHLNRMRDVTLLKDSVDIVEAGTILCLNEGLGAVKALREQCPDKIIVADWKVADAGETLAQQAFAAGANWMTIICAAPLATVEKGHAMAQNCGGEIQIELFGNWTLDDARDWHRIGVRQAIYHRGRDAQASGQQWGEADLARMKALSDIGLELSITGGITPADLPLFKDIRVKAFIAGRALAGAVNPAQVAADFHAQIDAIWGGSRA